MSSSPQYEFTQEQNTLVGSLASKMRFVGAFAVALGVVGLLITALVIAAIYRDRLPAGWADRIKEYQQAAREKLPEDARTQVDQYTPDKLPANHHLWGIAIYAGVTGVFFLLLGVWTRSAGGSFQKIVDTQGSDITNLMNALSSLQSMYGLLHLLLVLALLGGLVAVGLTLYQYFVAR
jgi:hypothetical protein